MVAQVYDMMVAWGLCVTLAPHCRMAFLAGGALGSPPSSKVSHMGRGYPRHWHISRTWKCFSKYLRIRSVWIRLESIEGPDETCVLGIFSHPRSMLWIWLARPLVGCETKDQAAMGSWGSGGASNHPIFISSQAGSLGQVASTLGLLTRADPWKVKAVELQLELEGLSRAKGCPVG